MSTTTIIQNDTFNNLLTDLQLEDYQASANAQALINAEARYIKDLKINTGNVLNNNQHLSRKEALLLAFGVAVNEQFDTLKTAFARLAEQEGATEKEIAEVVACASLMATNNVFYRFRHFMGKDFYQNTPAGIKMSIMMNPVLGKEFFELLSLVVSALNGCEMCVTSHEQSVLNHGGTQARIFDAVRIGAVFKSFTVLI